MVVGLVGSGNMARALARGWGRPVLCTDVVSGRAAAQDPVTDVAVRELFAELGIVVERGGIRAASSDALDAVVGRR